MWPLLSSLLVLPLLLVFLFQCLTYFLCLVINIRQGDLKSEYGKDPGGAFGAYVLAFIRSLASACLLLLFYPLHRGFGMRCPPGPAQPTPIIVLVHGLYHNDTAWLLFRRWLRRAGYRHICSWSYPSLWRDFNSLTDRLDQKVTRITREAPDCSLVLIGHSLGGLLVRDLAQRLDRRGSIAGLVTLACPHQGSWLARLGINSLARSLHPSAPLIHQLNSRELPVDIPKLNLYPSVDNMVLPRQALRMTGEGWEEQRIGPLGHVGVLFSKAAAQRVIAFMDKHCSFRNGTWRAE